jgi:site-specific recombinase XerD
MICTEQTMVFYQKTLGKFIECLDQKGVSEPDHISSKHMREFLAGHKERGCPDSYIHTFARSIRKYTRFLEGEGYVKEIVTFQMPRIGQNQH